MRNNATVDGFFGFFDKHFSVVLGAIAAFILYLVIKKNTPTTDEKAAQADEAAKEDVNIRLQTVPAPKPKEDGKLDPKEEQAYWAKQKAHRSAVFAQRLFDAMRTSAGLKRLADIGGAGAKIILGVAQEASLARVGLPMLQADYLALQDAGLLGKAKLLDDLKSMLSTADYLTFMRRVGLTPEQTAAELKKPAKK